MTVNLAAGLRTWERGLLEILTNLIDNLPAAASSELPHPPRISHFSQLSRAARSSYFSLHRGIRFSFLEVSQIYLRAILTGWYNSDTSCQKLVIRKIHNAN